MNQKINSIEIYFIIEKTKTAIGPMFIFISYNKIFSFRHLENSIMGHWRIVQNAQGLRSANDMGSQPLSFL